MKRFEAKMVKTLELVEITCDICGCKKEINSEFHTFRYSGGYYSTLLGDCNQFQVDLCERCLVDNLHSKLKDANACSTYDYNRVFE